MLFHLAYITLAGGYLPLAIRTTAKAVFAASIATKLKESATTDRNVVFAVEELDRFQKTEDVHELRRIHAAAAKRGEDNIGDSHCSHCGQVTTSLLFHAFNSQMILTLSEWDEVEKTTSADRFRLLIGTGRKRAEEWRAVYRTALLGFDTCPKCGASTSAKTLQKTG